MSTGEGRGVSLGFGLDVEKCTGSCFMLSVASARARTQYRSFCNNVPEGADWGTARAQHLWKSRAFSFSFLLFFPF